MATGTSPAGLNAKSWSPARAMPSGSGRCARLRGDHAAPRGPDLGVRFRRGRLSGDDPAGRLPDASHPVPGLGQGRGGGRRRRLSRVRPARRDRQRAGAGGRLVVPPGDRALRRRRPRRPWRSGSARCSGRMARWRRITRRSRWSGRSCSGSRCAGGPTRNRGIRTPRRWCSPWARGIGRISACSGCRSSWSSCGSIAGSRPSRRWCSSRS